MALPRQIPKSPQFQQAEPEQKIAILQHEMVTPVATILGAVELLQRIDSDATQDLPKEFHHSLDWLAKAGNHLKYLLDALTETHHT